MEGIMDYFILTNSFMLCHPPAAGPQPASFLLLSCGITSLLFAATE